MLDSASMVFRQPYERFHKKIGADFPQQLLVRRVGIVEFQSDLVLLTPPGDKRRTPELPAFPRQDKIALLVNLQARAILQQASEDAQVLHHHRQGSALRRQLDAGLHVS